MKKNALLKSSVITGITNAAINGGIQYFFLKGRTSIPITVDSITNNEDTVLGSVVILALILAMILTMVSYFGVKEEKIKFFPQALLLTIKHGFFTFGVLTSLAVLWQKYMGEVEVSTISALFIIGITAGIVAGIVHYLTIKHSIILKKYPLPIRSE